MKKAHYEGTKLIADEDIFEGELVCADLTEGLSSVVPEVQAMQEIRRVEEFTKGYWLPALENARKNIEDNPTLPKIIEDIISTRGRYVQELKDRLSQEKAEPSKGIYEIHYQILSLIEDGCDLLRVPQFYDRRVGYTYGDPKTAQEKLEALYAPRKVQILSYSRKNEIAH